MDGKRQRQFVYRTRAHMIVCERELWICTYISEKAASDVHVHGDADVDNADADADADLGDAIIVFL